MEEYMISHRPGNPKDYPNEVATLDKVTYPGFFPSDILTNARDYFPDYGCTGDTNAVLSFMRLAQGRPEMDVTVYRGAPSDGVLNTGDWVTLSKEYAMQYAAGGAYSDKKDSKVYQYTVKAKELSFDGDSLYEFGYWGKRIKS